MEIGFRMQPKEQESGGKFFKNTSFQLGLDLQKVQKQLRDLLLMLEMVYLSVSTLILLPQLLSKFIHRDQTVFVLLVISCIVMFWLLCS